MHIWYLYLAISSASYIADDFHVPLGHGIAGGICVNFDGDLIMPGLAFTSIFNHDSQEEGQLNADPSSTFAHMVGRFLILYSNRTLIIRPNDPADFCFNREITYIESAFSYIYSVMVKVDLVDVGTEQVLHTWENCVDGSISSIPFSIDFSSEFDVVPDEILSRIEDIVADNVPIGFMRTQVSHNSRNNRSFRFVCGTTDMIDQLPIVQYTIMSSNGGESQPATVVRLYPRDYIDYDIGQSSCVSRLRSWYGSPHRPGVFGIPFISVVALMFDVQDDRVLIGFGEPI